MYFLPWGHGDGVQHDSSALSGEGGGSAMSALAGQDQQRRRQPQPGRRRVQDQQNGEWPIKQVAVVKDLQR